MKSIQFKLSENEFNRVKARLAERGLTWQTWASSKALEILEESTDDFGIPLTEMAFDRSAFQNKIAEKLVGALGEYAFIQLARANQQRKWVTHKQTEVQNLLFQMVLFLDLPTKGRFDKKKAALEMIEFYEDKLQKFATRAKNAYAVYYKEKPKKDISPDDLLDLLEQAKKMIKLSD
jgi:hypothetical protein